MSEENPEADRISVHLKWDSVDELPTLFANQMYVTHASNSEFYIVFGEVLIPAIDAEIPPNLRVKPVAKIVLTPDFMKNMLDVLASNYAGWQTRQGGEGQGGRDG